MDKEKAANVQLLEPAVPVLKPVKPKKGLNVLLGGFFGLLAGIVVVFLIEFIYSVFSSRENVQQFPGLPVRVILPKEQWAERVAEQQQLIVIQQGRTHSDALPSSETGKSSGTEAAASAKCAPSSPPLHSIRVDYDRREAHDANSFAAGGTENWSGQGDRRSQRDRRRLWKDRRRIDDPFYSGSERRNGIDRRNERDRRCSPLKHSSLEKSQDLKGKVSCPLAIMNPQGSMAGIDKDVSSAGDFVRSEKPLRASQGFSISINNASPRNRCLSVSAELVQPENQSPDDEVVAYLTADRRGKLSHQTRKPRSPELSAQHRDKASGDKTCLPFIVISQICDLGLSGPNVTLKIDPGSYPLVTLSWEEHHDDKDAVFGTEASFPKLWWINLANSCMEIADCMDASDSAITVEALISISKKIMAEIESEDKRMLNKEYYESLTDFVNEISKRTDLDNTEKARIIHDKASSLHLKSNDLSDFI